jgi:hypothetical protein
VDDRLFGADGDRNQVAVPPRQLLERREQLVALRAALHPAQPLLGLALREVELGELLFGRILGARAVRTDA